MRNLFLHPETWSALRNIDVSSDFLWTLRVEGSYSDTGPNSFLSHGDLSSGDMLRGNVSYTISYEDNWLGNDLFFIIRTLSGETIFSYQLLVGGEGETSSGTFDIDLDVHGVDNFFITVSTDENFEATPYGYDPIGTVVITPEVPPPPPPPRPRGYVFELDRGWSFDGMYIPHFLELNWYFGEDPFTYHGIQKIRIHGLSKGYAKLDVTVNGMQTDYTEDYSKNPQYIDLLSMPVPELEGFVAEEFYSATSYADVANRGISIQMKFSGRNTVCDLPEPSHVIQVLAIQQAPSGARAN